MISKRNALTFAPLVLLLAGCPGPGAVDGVALRPAAFERVAAADQGDFSTCDAPVGRAAVVQPGDEVLDRLAEMDLGSPEPLLRKLMLESNCFEVVDLDLISDQESRNALHYILRPEVTANDPETFGIDGSRRVGELFGEDVDASGGLDVRTVAAMLSLNDAATGVLLAAAEGTAAGADVSGSVEGLEELDLGAYASTPEGKVVAAAFADAFGRLVAGLRDQEIQAASR